MRTEVETETRIKILIPVTGVKKLSQLDRGGYYVSFLPRMYIYEVKHIHKV